MARGNFEPFRDEDAGDLTREVVQMAEQMVQPLLAKAHESDDPGEVAKGVTKLILAMGMGLAFIGTSYYAEIGTEAFVKHVAKLLQEAMVNINAIKEATDEPTAENTEGSSWDRRR